MKLFISIPLNETATNELNLVKLGLKGLDMQDEPFYIPLLELGEVEGSLQKEIEEELSFIEQTSFPLQIKGTHSVKSGSAHILLAKLLPSDELETFKRKIYQQLKPFKLEMKKQESHIWIAKWEVKSDHQLAAWLESTSQLACPSYQPTHFALYSFHPTYKKKNFQEEKSFPFDLKSMRPI